MSKNDKYLILGCNRFQVNRFAKLNGLAPKDYICVLSYKQMYGHTNGVLIVLDGWTINMHKKVSNDFLNRFHWFKKRNSIKYLTKNDKIIFTKTILRVVEERIDDGE